MTRIRIPSYLINKNVEKIKHYRQFDMLVYIINIITWVLDSVQTCVFRLKPDPDQSIITKITWSGMKLFKFQILPNHPDKKP